MYPASSKTAAQRSQLLGKSHRPWMNTTGVRPVAFARSASAASCSVIVAVADLSADSVLVISVPPRLDT